MKLFISDNKLNDWLNDLIGNHVIFAPVKKKELTFFKPITKVGEISFDFCNTTLSPKDWFFPPSEILFSIDNNSDEPEIEQTKNEMETIIFGIRPCDAKGISLLDVPMLHDPPDSLYKERRDKTTLIGISCIHSQPECFCTSMGSTPDDASNVDILLTKADNGYIVQEVTEKGKALLPKDLPEASLYIPSPPEVQSIQVTDLSEVMKKFFSNPYWERLAERCIHCNICASVCPTCYCFDVRDYSDHNKVERVRSQESCQATCFTKIAGGQDHRATKGSRLRQRFYHKFLYFSEQFNQVIDCVGCGRCVKSCPVNIDIREIIKDLQLLEAKSGS